MMEIRGGMAGGRQRSETQAEDLWARAAVLRVVDPRP